jgi:cytoskeletal protein CcmA (bactofilin family)
MAWFDRNPGGKKSPEVEPVVKVAETPNPEPKPAPVAVAPEPKPLPKAEPAPQPATAGLVGYLHKGSRVSGQLSFQGPARIDGVVEGEIQCQGPLTIGDGAEVRAKISGQIVVIRGKVEGNVTAKERVELLAPARLIGNVTAPRLIITEGVVFDGDCSMGVGKQKSAINGSQIVNVDRVAAAPSMKLQADSKT